MNRNRLWIAHCTFLLVHLFYLPASSNALAGVLVDATGNDTAGDTFGSKDFDLLSMKVDVSNVQISIRLTFAEEISLDSANVNYVAGFLDLDLDRNLSTDIDGLRLPGQISGGSNVEFYADGSGENFQNASLGTDLYVDLFPSLSGAGSNQVDIVDVRSGNILLGFADLMIGANSKELSIVIPQSLFVTPIAEGSFHVGAIIGAIPTTFDPFPSDVAVSISRPVNPPVIPEPSSFLIFTASSIATFLRRRVR